MCSESFNRTLNLIVYISAYTYTWHETDEMFVNIDQLGNWAENNIANAPSLMNCKYVTRPLQHIASAGSSAKT